jgi:hypothetical protein
MGGVAAAINRHDAVWAVNSVRAGAAMTALAVSIR